MRRLLRSWLVLALLGTACAETSTIVGLPDTSDGKPGQVEEDGQVVIGPVDDLGGDFGVREVDEGGEGLSEVAGPEGLWELPGELVQPPELVEPELVEPELVEEVVEPPDTGDCVAQCGLKECGSDGCDGVCGYCAYGYLCSPQGKCVANICPKQCTAIVEGKEKEKECGPDECGGYCGYCIKDGTVCGEDGFCYAGSCTPQCKDKICGPDGCGGSCGFCKTGELCDGSSKCVPHPCGDVGYKGKCESKFVLLECVDLKLQETQCKSIKDHMCGWDQAVGKYACVPETECEPKCTFDDGAPMECGPDGCWGSCGMCAQGWGCSGGYCKPATGAECAWVDSTVGVCFDDVRWFCAAGKLYGYDCQAKEGKKCGWNPKANFGLGGYDCI